MPKKPPFSECQLCRRGTELTFHHLIPKKMHRRPRFKRVYTREQLNSGIWICYACHRGLHRLYTELQLATHLNTLEKLCTDEAVMRHVEWVAKQR